MLTTERVLGGITIILLMVVIVISLLKVSTEKDDTNDRTLVVSILPLKSIVSKIVGHDYQIDVLMPSGSSPETYEPTPKQLVALSDADLVFTVGLIDFERELVGKMRQQLDNKIVNLSDGIALLSGVRTTSTGDHGHHHHGVDPHIWTSPKQLKIMAMNALRAITLLHPDKKTYYESNYRKLLTELDELDVKVANMLDSACMKYFFIYHPAMAYYADDYNIEQIAIEQGGKEPSADQMKSLIDLARKEHIETILYQREFSRSMIETISKDIGATMVEIDPLAEDIFQSIIEITQHITGNRE